MGFEREDKEGNIRLKIEGPMSIYEVATLREELSACLENSEGLELDIEGVTDCDTAGIQLIYAARKTAEQGEKQFHVTGAPQTVLDTLRSAGLKMDEVI